MASKNPVGFHQPDLAPATSNDTPLQPGDRFEGSDIELVLNRLLETRQVFTLVTRGRLSELGNLAGIKFRADMILFDDTVSEEELVALRSLSSSCPNVTLPISLIGSIEVFTADQGRRAPKGNKADLVG